MHCAIVQALLETGENIFPLAASVWQTAPYSSLPTADENAVTGSAVTTVPSSLFQSAAVLTKTELLYRSVFLFLRAKSETEQHACVWLLVPDSPYRGRSA